MDQNEGSADVRTEMAVVQIFACLGPDFQNPYFGGFRSLVTSYILK